MLYNDHQQWNNVVYISIDIYNVEQRQIYFALCNFDMNYIGHIETTLLLSKLSLKHWTTFKERFENDHLQKNK